MLIVAALGFLFIALVELLLMRLQLAIPENTFLSPVTFNRMLSLYGVTAIFLFALPLALGFFYYVMPLQIGARGTALPRLGQIGALALPGRGDGALRGLPLHPVGGGRQPAGAALRTGLPAQQRGRRLGRGDRAGDARLRPDRDRPGGHPAQMRAPGMAWRRLPIFSWAAAICSWLLIVIGPVMLAAVTMLLIDRNFEGIFFAGDAGGAPLLWQHLSWIFFTGSYMLILITALGAIAEIVPALAGKPLFNRGATIGSLVAIAVIGTLAWMQNMLTAPIGIGWMYFAMVMALALIVPFGLVVFNLIATLAAARCGCGRRCCSRPARSRRSRSASPPRSRTRWSPPPGS